MASERSPQRLSRIASVATSVSPRDPIAGLPGIGPARAAALGEAGIVTVLDLLLHLPFRYEDRTTLAAIAQLGAEGPATTVKGTILSSRLIRTRRPGFTIFEAILDDGTGSLRLVFFNQPYLKQWLVAGRVVFVYGAPTLGKSFRRGLLMQNPELEMEDSGDSLAMGRVVPIYRKLPGLTPRLRRRLVAKLLDALGDRLPERLDPALLKRLALPPLGASLREAHFPGSAEGPADPRVWEGRTSAHLARLVFEEFLEFQLGLQRRRRERTALSAPVLAANDAIRARLRRILPFPLTGAQKRVVKEIRDDFLSGRPMMRLLQGDVGSGKTIVAFLASLLTAECGHQAAFMAPTEILAEQHAASIFKLLSGAGGGSSGWREGSGDRGLLGRFTPALLTGRVKGRPRAALLDALAGGRIDILIGTHALLEEPVAFHRLGFVVIDEQHRFGVAQRAALSSRVLATGDRPHVLVMSATPIPRSLALTLYGDLDVSTLDERPPGRTKVKTRVLPESERTMVFAEIEEEIGSGGQAYVVVPLVEESDKIEARAVEKHADDVRAALPNRRVGVVHGRMSSDEREKTMAEFVAGRLDVLAATTVIEVGVDVPNASYLIVENAERFGLAQLHQLRGRVGRGRRASRCVLLFGPNASAEARERLDVLAKTDDGFVVAEEDLERRGPGDALGTRQSGVPIFRVGDLVRDVKWMRQAHAEARKLLAEKRDAPFADPLFFSKGAASSSD